MTEPETGKEMAEGSIKGIDAKHVTDWFDAHIDAATPPLRFSLIVGGHSNLTYRVSDAVQRLFVLRRPPLGAVLATAHDMSREHRIIAALADTPVPVPAALGLCQDESVNGAPFYVMSFVEGWVLAEAETVDAHFDLSVRPRIAEHLIDVLAELHAVDIDAVGLGGLGRRESYLARQLKRWSTQWEKSKTRELPAMEEIHHTLESRMPEQVGASVVHGDYRLGNMITDANARIAAVLDWELCALGDPIADVGYLMNNWLAPGEAGPSSRGAAMSPSSAGGFPTRSEMLARYAEKTGRDVSQVDYYRAFQLWRMAAIVEGVLARYLKGVMGDRPDTGAFRAQVDGLAAAALVLARQMD